MRIIDGIEAARFSGVVLTIGNFDGVHCGHRALLARGAELARQAGAELVAMTFEPHPAAVLAPDRVPATLAPLHEKLRLLAEAGVHATVIVRSRAEFFALTAEEFIREVIVARFHPRVCVEGGDFRFGQHRHGDVAMLRQAGIVHGFEVVTVEPTRAALGGHPDTVISSSLVRHLLASGNVERAAMCLGRPYTLLGTIRRGVGRGRTLGFPTANLAVEGQLVPAEGVYAGVARVCGGSTGDGAGDGSPRADERERGGGSEGEMERWRNGEKEGTELSAAAAISIGQTPTFGVQEQLIEAHLIDFSGDLYDRPMRLEFIDWVRGQERFASAEALKEQIRRDVAQVRRAIRNLIVDR